MYIYMYMYVQNIANNLSKLANGPCIFSTDVGAGVAGEHKFLQPLKNEALVT